MLELYGDKIALFGLDLTNCNDNVKKIVNTWKYCVTMSKQGIGRQCGNL